MPRGLRRGSAAARLLGLWVRIQPGNGSLCLMSVVFCQVEVYASGRSLFQKSPIERGVCEYDREASIMRRPWPIEAVEPWKEVYIYIYCQYKK